MTSNQGTLQNEKTSKSPLQGDILDPWTILSLIIRNWYFFILAIIIALLGARFYVKHTMPVYRTSTTLLINDTDERPVVDNTELLQGLGLPGGLKNLENQIMILESGSLVEETLKELPFEIEYYIRTLRNRLPIYPEEPIRILSDGTVPLPRNIEFSIVFMGNSMFNLESEDKHFSFQKTASFGDTIKFQAGNFVIDYRDEEWINKNLNQKLYFIIYSSTRLIRNYSQRLAIEKVNREGSVLRISLQGANSKKDADFLNKHIENFQSISLTKKNMEAERRIQFIDDQLVGISDSLSTTENKLQQFRSANRVMDLSAQGQAIIGQVTLLENEKATLELEASYYDYLADYLSKDLSGEMPIVPVTMGITDATLTRLVDELTVLQGQLTTRGAGQLNPLQKNLEQRVRTTKDALQETLNGLRRANSLARRENQERISRANAQASALPVTERKLLGIERKFTLNNELYTFLLETRAEQQMQKASNRADSEVIDPADERFSSLISPIPMQINLFATAGAMVITFLLLFVKAIFNKKLKEEDLRKTTNLPIVGNIPRSSEKTNTIVLNNPASTISEAYRLLRSRMQFFTKEAATPVILITSSMPGEGKTFTAINLASAYSLLEKKTVLIGFDLRKPKIFQDFNLTNESGVSTWLIGKDKIQDIIQETSFKNLSVISAGPIPPNPSELTALGKTKELITYLKEKFDFIIVDTSPMGIVSDTIYLASLADACLLVVRPGVTLRDMLEITLNELSANQIKGVSLIMNDIQSDSKHYGYGERYGYVSSKDSGKKRWGKGRRVRSGSKQALNAS